MEYLGTDCAPEIDWNLGTRLLQFAGFSIKDSDRTLSFFSRNPTFGRLATARKAFYRGHIAWSRLSEFGIDAGVCHLSDFKISCHSNLRRTRK
jgi:hypothetical protein